MNAYRRPASSVEVVLGDDLPQADLYDLFDPFEGQHRHEVCRTKADLRDDGRWSV